MSLVEQIEKDYIKAYKAKEEMEISVLRMLKSSIKNAEITKKDKLNDDDVVAVIKKEAKQRKETAEEYVKAGKNEIAEKELLESKILEKYLPTQLSEEETKKIVDDTISKLNATTPAMTGQVIGKIMGQYKGQIDGSLVAKLVRESLQK